MNRGSLNISTTSANLGRSNRLKQLSLWAMSAAYIGAGANHFMNTAFYRPMMPPWIPLHEPMILVSGLAEICLGVGLIFEPTRKISGWLIIAMLLVFFNVHVYMWLERDTTFVSISPLLLLARLPLQLLLIWWAYTCSTYSKLSGNSSTLIVSP
jgi:uncharacterized membrane protein